MYTEKINALLEEALQETEKLLMENGEKICVFSNEPDLDVMTMKDGVYHTARAVRLHDTYIQVLIYYYDHWEWTDADNLVLSSYAELHDFVAEHLNSAITYEESEKLEETEDDDWDDDDE